MRMKKTVSALAALAMSASAFAGICITANAAGTIYSNDFSETTLDDVVTWTGAGKKPSGYSHAQIGRAGGFTLSDGSLLWQPTGGQSKDTNKPRASYGVFCEEIQTQTSDSNYKISFDWRPTCLNLEQDVALELINKNKNVILGLNLDHARNNSSSGSSQLVYYAGGKCGFKCVEDSATSGQNAEGTIGEAKKNSFETDENANFDKGVYKVELVIQSSGVGNLSITDSDLNVKVNDEMIIVDPGVGLSDIYLTARSYNADPNGAIYLDNFVIEPVEIENPASIYTINYEVNGATIRTEKSGGYVGAAPVVDMNPFTVEDGAKYYCTSNDAADKTIAEDGTTVITVECREANRYNVQINAQGNDGNDLGTIYSASDIVEDTQLTVPYPRYIKTEDGKLYFKDAVSSEYNYKFTVNDDTYNKPIEYALQEGKTAVYYEEAEDVFGYKSVDNDGIRCSMGKGGDVESKQELITLEPGKYTISSAVWGGRNAEGANSTYTFTAGDTKVFDITTTGSHMKNTSEEFTLTSKTAIYIEKTVTGNRGACIDYILIERTSEAELSAAAEHVETYVDDTNEAQVWQAAINGIDGFSFKTLQASAEYEGAEEPAVSDEVEITNITGSGSVYAAVVIENTKDKNVTGVTVTLK